MAPHGHHWLPDQMEKQKFLSTVKGEKMVHALGFVVGTDGQVLA